MPRVRLSLGRCMSRLRTESDSSPRGTDRNRTCLQDLRKLSQIFYGIIQKSIAAAMRRRRQQKRARSISLAVTLAKCRRRNKPGRFEMTGLILVSGAYCITVALQTVLQ